MPSKGTENLNRLPKWARARVELAEREAKHWKYLAYTSAGADPEKTNVLVQEGMERRGLPKDSRIEFVLPGGNPDRRATLMVHLEEDHLVVMGYNGGNTIKIHPRAANVVWVEVEK